MRLLPSFIAMLAITGHAAGQGGDTVSLGVLQAAAAGHDPRSREFTMIDRLSALRQDNIAGTMRPKFTLLGNAQYQSEVAAIPFALPGGVSVARHRDSYDAHGAVYQPLLDPQVGARREVERARNAEARERLQTSLYTLRQGVADLYFESLLADVQLSVVDAAVMELESQLQSARARVSEGAALPSEAEMIEAELIRRRQLAADYMTRRDVALGNLADLTGAPIDATTPLRVPDLADAVAAARVAAAPSIRRPELDRFASSRELLASQQAEVASRRLPRLSAVGRLGYGRPGLNPLDDAFGSYWLGGVQVEWAPFDWGRTSREMDMLAVEQEIVSVEEAAFRDQVRRSVRTDLASIDQLERALEDDDAIVALREGIMRETTIRFGEGVITSSELVDRQADLLTSRLARATHRVQLARTRAHFLTSIGVEVP